MYKIRKTKPGDWGHGRTKYHVVLVSDKTDHPDDGVAICTALTKENAEYIANRLNE